LCVLTTPAAGVTHKTHTRGRPKKTTTKTATQLIQNGQDPTAYLSLLFCFVVVFFWHLEIGGLALLHEEGGAPHRSRIRSCERTGFNENAIFIANLSRGKRKIFPL
jgi:hypothetical protein